LVLLSIVVVPLAPAGRFRKVAAAPTVSARAMRAPPWTVAPRRAEIVADGHLRHHLVGGCRGEGHAHQDGEGQGMGGEAVEG
jgi:hypothetical protein